MVDEYKKLKFFGCINTKPKKEMILSRLGYRKNTTIQNKDFVEKLDNAIKEASLICRIQGVYGIFQISKKESDRVFLENHIDFKSEQLYRLLEYSDEILLMACTVGRDIVERISYEITEGDPVLGVIFDSVASQTADSGIDFLVHFVSKIIEREGKKLTKSRYSPGYGDLGLENQKKIYSTLSLDKIGIRITEKYILEPEKSVIAIAGIERTI